jgi:hypothetical protein
MVVELATLSPRRRPFVTPLWFVVDHGALYLTTGTGSRAGRNIVQHPQVALLFSGERSGQRTELLRLRGKATCHSGLPSWQVLLRVAAKYYVSPRALLVELRNAGKWPLRARYYGQVKGGVGYLRVVPTGAEFLALP